MARLTSLVLLLFVWRLAAGHASPRYLPTPEAVFSAMLEEARSGALFSNLAVTLARVAAAFLIAMAVGSALGVAMGRKRTLDAFADPWIVVLLNIPALVIIVLAYVWAGLTETAAIGAVALNKLPNTVVTLREGARAIDPSLDEMAGAFRMPLGVRLRHVVLPQLWPYFAAATRSGLSLVWKIVLVVEFMGRPNGVGFEIGTAFQLFDVKLLLAYTIPFVCVMLAIETIVVQPIERRVSRWRSRPA